MIAQIENAMLTRLTSANTLGLLGYAINTVASYDGVFDDATSLTTIVTQIPGVWVTFLGEETTADRGYTDHEMTPSFRVIVAAGNKRTGADVGTYQMAKDVGALLSGQRLGLDIGYLKQVRVSTFPAVDNAMPGLSVMAVDFTATYTTTEAPDLPAAEIAADVPRDKGLAEAMAMAAGITDFTTSHADWAPPSTLSDTVTLEN